MAGLKGSLDKHGPGPNRVFCPDCRGKPKLVLQGNRHVPEHCPTCEGRGTVTDPAYVASQERLTRIMATIALLMDDAVDVAYGMTRWPNTEDVVLTLRVSAAAFEARWPRTKRE